MTRLILGLGNPGEEYRASRHNAGFRVVEELARRWRVRLGRLECNSLTALVETGAGGGAVEAAAGAGAVETAAATRAPEAAGGAGSAGGVLLAKPQTYMNRSGFAARCLVELHGLDPGAVLVVYDEINLPHVDLNGEIDTRLFDPLQDYLIQHGQQNRRLDLRTEFVYADALKYAQDRLGRV